MQCLPQGFMAKSGHADKRTIVNGLMSAAFIFQMFLCSSHLESQYQTKDATVITPNVLCPRPRGNHLP